MGKDNKKDLHVILVSGDYAKICKEVEKNQINLIKCSESTDFYKEMQKAYPEFKIPYITIFKNGKYMVFSDSGVVLGEVMTLELEQKKLENLIDQVASCGELVYGMDKKSIATIVACFNPNEKFFAVTMKNIAEKYSVITHEIDYKSNLEINPMIDPHKIVGTKIIKGINPFPIHKKNCLIHKKTFPFSN